MAASARIGAIETEYKGYRFRSRLEARWAVFFDALDIEWQYEPQGFERGDVRYLPDFYLPYPNVWVEVKGCWTEQDAGRMAHILDFCSPIPGVQDSDESGSGGLLLLGNIPEPIHGLIFHPLVTHRKGLCLRYAKFVAHNPDVAEYLGIKKVGTLERLSYQHATFCTYFTRDLKRDEFMDGWGAGSKEALDFFSTKHVSISTVFASLKITDAYRAARQARFEHGA